MSNKLELERCPFCGEEAVVEELKEGEYMANCPECGAGAIIIAVAERLRAVGLSGRNFYFVANDIDSKCAMMAYIQCTLLDIPAIIYTGDTLKMDFRYCRPTLSFLVNFADRFIGKAEVA